MRTENKGLKRGLTVAIDGITINVEFHCVTCGVSVTARVTWRQYRAMEEQWWSAHNHVEDDEPPNGDASIYKDSAGEWKLRYPSASKPED